MVVVDDDLLAVLVLVLLLVERLACRLAELPRHSLLAEPDGAAPTVPLNRHAQEVRRLAKVVRLEPR